jgi:hypothetical protein
MKIAYTVCSLNRLGQIITLGESLLRHNPDYHFVIGLADELNGRINVEDYKSFEFIPLSALHLPNQNQLTGQYTIFELSCALKAYYASYLLKKYHPEIVLYFDTDICVYDKLTPIEDVLADGSIVLSPHFVTPLPADGKYPLERDVLGSGLYNGGFVGFRDDANGIAFVNWWQERLKDQGYNNICESMMVDQLWLNLAPLFFRQVRLLDHAGCNTAYWNMHERTIRQTENLYFVNDKPLVFFHFSGYRIEHPDKLSEHQNRFTANANKAVESIFHDYHNRLIKNKFSEYFSFECVYGKKGPEKRHSFLKSKIIKILARSGYKLEKIRAF